MANACFDFAVGVGVELLHLRVEAPLELNHVFDLLRSAVDLATISLHAKAKNTHRQLRRKLCKATGLLPSFCLGAGVRETYSSAKSASGLVARG